MLQIAVVPASALDVDMRTGVFGDSGRGIGTTSSLNGFPSHDVAAYLRELMSKFHRSASTAHPLTDASDDAELPQRIFALLTHRDFSYLSKSKTAPYRAAIEDYLHRATRARQPLAFYYDIGGGYHATVRPGESGLMFDVGLAEVFALSQIAAFHRRVVSIYPPGTRFSFVIDNLCALLINDIPTRDTTSYCARLRKLIRALHMDDIVDVLVESELFDTDRYPVDGLDTRRTSVTDKELENVERFLGRRCDRSEAVARVIRYEHVTRVSEQLFNSVIDGVHMTQRASPTTIAFRPFPGGDSRIQAGEVAITRNAKGHLHPVLVTSENIDLFRCERFRASNVLPEMIGDVCYAERRSA